MRDGKLRDKLNNGKPRDWKLEKGAMNEMRINGRYKKQTFNELLKYAGISQTRLLKYIKEQRQINLEILEQLQQMDILKLLKQVNILEQLWQLGQLEQLVQWEKLERIEQWEKLKEWEKLNILEELGQLEQMKGWKHMEEWEKLDLLEQVEKWMQLDQMEISEDKKYNSSYISNMLREKSTDRSPTKELSKYLEKLLKEEGIFLERNENSGYFNMKYCQAIKEKKHDWGNIKQEEILEIEMKKNIDESLPDDMLYILYDNFDLFCQFNSILWDTIKRLEQCTEDQRLRIKCEFIGKTSRRLLEKSREEIEDNEKLSKKLKKKSEELWQKSEKKKQESEKQIMKGKILKEKCEQERERLKRESEKLLQESEELSQESEELLECNIKIKDMLNFSWHSYSNNREHTLDKVMEFWKQWDLPLWNNLDVLGNMDEEVWEITKMIILSDCHTQSEDFSPRIRKN